MRLYNSLTNRKEEFVPLEEGKVKMYCCGPTVYNYFHLGNARPFIMFDLLRRYFEYRGYEVTFVQNFTDIDDKMIKRANEEGITVAELGDRFIEEYKLDAEGLGIRPATVHPRATKHIGEMIKLIKGLEKKGLAYAVNGDVYYDTEKFRDYGELAEQDMSELRNGASERVSTEDSVKHNPMDFALWKAAKPGEPSFKSPWGEGRPGWHIECSAMSMKYLGETMDIHCGGRDLRFPHHTNEIAQSEGYTGKKMANYWLHNGFINVNNEKMSKSLGNFFTIRDISREMDLEIVRFFMISAHYRGPVNYSADLLAAASAGLDRLYNAKLRLRQLMREAKETAPTADEIKAFVEPFEAVKAQFIEAMDDDFNTADAVTALYAYAKLINSNLTAADGREKLQAVYDLYMELAGVMGILEKNKEALPEGAMELIEARKEARANKNYALSDELRDKLAAMGVIVEDTREGMRWSVK